MLLFWILIITLTLVLSLFLAIRSMRGFDKNKQTKSPDQALFLIRNSHLINSQLLTKLHQLSLAEGFTFSFERLFKGQESALVIFGPKVLENLLPELGLLELEDYLITREETIPGQASSRVTADQAFGWVVPFTNESFELNAVFLNNLELKDQEQFFWQLVFKSLQPLKNQPNLNEFQLTVRVMVTSNDKNEKIKLAKRIADQITAMLQLDHSEKIQTNPRLYDQYLARTTSSNKDKLNRFSSAQALQLLNI